MMKQHGSCVKLRLREFIRQPEPLLRDYGSAGLITSVELNELNV